MLCGRTDGLAVSRLVRWEERQGRRGVIALAVLYRLMHRTDREELERHCIAANHCGGRTTMAKWLPFGRFYIRISIWTTDIQTSANKPTVDCHILLKSWSEADFADVFWKRVASCGAVTLNACLPNLSGFCVTSWSFLFAEHSADLDVVSTLNSWVTCCNRSALSQYCTDVSCKSKPTLVCHVTGYGGCRYGCGAQSAAFSSSPAISGSLIWPTLSTYWVACVLRTAMSVVFSRSNNNNNNNTTFV